MFDLSFEELKSLIYDKTKEINYVDSKGRLKIAIGKELYDKGCDLGKQFSIRVCTHLKSCAFTRRFLRGLTSTIKDLPQFALSVRLRFYFFFLTYY